MSHVTFQVEQAGCESCAARVRSALEPLADVTEIAIDSAAGAATVRASGDGLIEDAVNRALETASHGSGHAYHVKSGSWQVNG